MPADELPAHVESLPSSQRRHELALQARRLADGGRLRDVLAELSAQGPHERAVALHLAMAGRDLDHVARVLAGPDLRLRRAALRAVRTLPVPDQAAAAVLEDAPADLRRAFYRTLAHARRTEPADRLLPEVRARWGDPDAAALLPACSAGVVAAVLPELAHAVVPWRAIGKRHPGALLDMFEAQSPPVWRWRRYLPGLEFAARSLPARMLSMLEHSDLARCPVPLSAPAIRALVRFDPVRTARILLGAWRPWEPTDTYLRTLRWWPVPEVLAAAPRIPEALHRLLGALPPGLREAVFDAVVEHDGGSRGGVGALPALPLLPPERAAAEARRMLEWHASTWHSSRSHLDDPGLPLRLTSHLPYEEAAGPLTEAAGSGDPRLRGLARTLLVECAARTGDPAVLRRLLSELTPRAVTDRDPLRGSLLATLAQVRPVLLGDGLAHDFGRLSAAAIDAADSSAVTRRAVRALADRVLRHLDPGSAPDLTAWALDVYAHLVARHGAEGLAPAPSEEPFVRRRRRRNRRQADRGHRLDLVLRPGQERELYDGLRSLLRSARERGDFTVAVALARSLRRRAFGIEELQGDLREAVLHAPEQPAREAAGLWLADRARREERAVALLRTDPSTIDLPEVWRVVAGRRTDLLATLPEEHAGWVSEPPARTVRRWTPAQQDHVRALLGRVIADEARSLQLRVNAMAWLGRISGSVDELTGWAEHDDTVLAEAALDALAHGDDPERALRVLLPHGRGRSSRAVVAAMARCCAAIPPSRLSSLLGTALNGPDGKVTVRKQAAWQLMRNRPPGAVDLLLDAWNDPDLHKDVRVSVAGALRRIPEDVRSLRALDAATGPYAGEPLFRALCQAQPWEYAPAHRPAYAALILRLLGAATDPGVRFRTAKAFGIWAQWCEDGHDATYEAVADPADPAGDERLPVFLALLRGGRADEQVLSVLERLLAAGLLPRARDRIVTIARGLASPRPTAEGRDLARRAAELLAAHPRHLAQGVPILIEALPRPGDDPRLPDRLADALWRLADLLRDRPVLAERTFGDRRFTARIGPHGRYSVPPDTLLPAVRRLAAGGHLVAELLALTLLDNAGHASGWTAPWREALDGLRRSPHVEIHSAAWHIVPSDP